MCASGKATQRFLTKYGILGNSDSAVTSFVKGANFACGSNCFDEKTVVVNGRRYFWYVEYKCVDANGGGVRSASDADANNLLDSDNDGVPDYIDSDSDGGRWRMVHQVISLRVLCLKTKLKHQSNTNLFNF